MKIKWLCLILIAAICLSGCSDHYDKSDLDDAYQRGIDEGWNQGHEDGYAEGFTDGYAAAENSFSAQLESEKEEVLTYIINKSSRKFHLPTCSSVSKMKESNKVQRSATRTELIEEGYSPCQECKP